MIPGVGGGGDGAGGLDRGGRKDAKVWSSREVLRSREGKESKVGKRNMHRWSPGATYLTQRTLIGRNGR